MSEDLFLRPSGYRRPNWGKRVLLLLLAATVMWLLSGCQGREAPSLAAQIVVMVVCGVVLICLVIFAPRKIRADDETAALRWCAIGQIGAAENDDPLAMPYQGMVAADVERILAALISECHEAEGLVEKAQGNLGVEDYADGLAGAQRRLKGMRLCLSNLQQKFRAPEVEVTLRMEVGAFHDGIEKFRQGIKRLSRLMAERSQWVRGYDSTAASYRPAHGGYGA